MSENKIIKLVQDGKVDEAVQLIIGSGWVHPFDMPREVEKLAEFMDLEAQALKSGDVLDATGRTVSHVNRAVKYVHVEFEDGGNKKRFEVGEKVRVIRYVKNQEHVRLESIDYELKRLIRTACSSRKAAQEATADVDVDNWLYHKLEAAAAATIEWQMWSRVLAHTGPEMTFLEALVYTADDLEDDLISDRYRGSSSNQWSNVYEAKQREVYANFCSRGFGGWSGIKYSMGQLFGFGADSSTKQILSELVRRTAVKFGIDQ